MPTPLPSSSSSSQLQMGLEEMPLEEVSDLYNNFQSSLSMTGGEISEFYENSPLQAAVITCGVKASVADGIAQARGTTNAALPDLELKRNLAYVLYGGIFIGAMCHYEYDVLFPLLFGNQRSLLTSVQEVLLDNFITAPLLWLPPAYLIKAALYDYSPREGLARYVADVRERGLLQKYWAVWVPAQSVSFTVVPEEFRIVFMASVSFFWFIKLSTLASESDDGTKAAAAVVVAGEDCN